MPYLTDERRARSLARGPQVMASQLRILRAHPGAASQPQAVDFGFATDEQGKAEQLAAALNRLGHPAQAKPSGPMAPWSSERLAHPRWGVSARSAALDMNEAALSDWVTEMQALGDAHDAEFTQWRWPAPTLLAEHEDYCLSVSPFDGSLDMSIYRWTAASEAALVAHEVSCISPGRGLGSLKVLAAHAGPIRKLRSPSDELPLTDLPVLHALEEIYLPSAPPAHGDYRELPLLHSFTCLDAETLPPQHVQHPGLKRLTLYRPRKFKTPAALAACTQLHSLVVRQAPWTTLTGLESLHALHTLRLAHCRSLTDVTALSGLQQLAVLELFKAPKLTALAPLQSLPGLRWIFAQGAPGPMDSFGALRHWPQLQCAHLLLPATQVDWAALASHPQAAHLVLYTLPGFSLPDEAGLRAALGQQGRQVRSLVLRPKDECPSVDLTFESPYWHLPEPPAGHHRTVVN